MAKHAYKLLPTSHSLNHCTMINFVRHTATDMYRKQDRQNKNIQLENIKNRPKTLSDIKTLNKEERLRLDV